MDTVILNASQFDILLSFLVCIGMCICGCIGFSTGFKGE